MQSTLATAFLSLSSNYCQGLQPLAKFKFDNLDYAQTNNDINTFSGASEHRMALLRMKEDIHLKKMMQKEETLKLLEKGETFVFNEKTREDLLQKLYKNTIPKIEGIANLKTDRRIGRLVLGLCRETINLQHNSPPEGEAFCTLKLAIQKTSFAFYFTFWVNENCAVSLEKAFEKYNLLFKDREALRSEHKRLYLAHFVWLSRNHYTSYDGPVLWDTPEGLALKLAHITRHKVYFTKHQPIENRVRIELVGCFDECFFKK